MTLAVVLVIAATYRATRFVTEDTFPPMAWARDRLSRVGFFDDLLHCPWCAGLWIAAGITWATWWLRDGGLVAPPLIALAASGVTGVVATVLPD